MRLLTGSSAVSSTLILKKVTDERLLAQFNQRANQLGFAEHSYQPWMSSTNSPPLLGTSTSPKSFNFDPFRFAEGSRFLDHKALARLKQFMVQTLLRRDPDESVAGFNWCDPTQKELQAFNDAIQEAEEELVRMQPHYAPLIENLIQGYVPIVDHGRSRQDFGMSSVSMKGVVYFNLYQEASLQRRVENLAHEIAHQILIHYQLNDFLIQPANLTTSTYSGIRGTNRPAILALHGAAALSAILETARAQKDLTREQQAHRWLKLTVEGLRTVPLTEVGKLILAEVTDVL